MTREFKDRTYGTFRVLSRATAQDIMIHNKGGYNKYDRHLWFNCRCTECKKTTVIRSDHITTQLCRCQQVKK